MAAIRDEAPGSARTKTMAPKSRIPDHTDILAGVEDAKGRIEQLHAHIASLRSVIAQAQDQLEESLQALERLGGMVGDRPDDGEPEDRE